VAAVPSGPNWTPPPTVPITFFFNGEDMKGMGGTLN
jgi:hypothetical protein